MNRPRTIVVKPIIALIALAVLIVACVSAPVCAMASGRAAAAAADTIVAGDAGTRHATPVDDTDQNAGGDSGQSAAPIAGPVPNVIITNFTYGDGSVPAGGKFDLGFSFQNKGAVAVQNMVISVDGGDGLTIAGGTNTFYVPQLAAGATQSQTVPMQALIDAKSGAQAVVVSFRYEYVDAGQRSSNSVDEKISVPVSQPDRFQINDPVIPDDAQNGQESTITLAYVNKGKGDISNVEATMDGKGFDTVSKTQYLGNVASGGSGTIAYAFTPTDSGDLDAKITVTYEDSDGQQKTKEFPVKLTVADPAPAMDDTAADMQDEQPSMPVWLLPTVAVVVVVAIIVIVMLVKRHRKKKRSAMDEQWDDWQDGQDSQDGRDSDDVPGTTQGHTSEQPATDDADRQAPTEVIAPQPGERS
ncbi:ABC transporter permease [Bifidobacterium thermophilum]|uniref:COG1361 S-layer family protein n=1 Tax=Bifidobacterium thermophilum TaxID=33905 RepID=UPI003097DE99